MATKPLAFDGDKLVTHADLRELVDHVSTLFAALGVRLTACEAALPVDPTVKQDADAFVQANNCPKPVLVP